jgi:hypothetical protein
MPDQPIHGDPLTAAPVVPTEEGFDWQAFNKVIDEHLPAPASPVVSGNARGESPCLDSGSTSQDGAGAAMNDPKIADIIDVTQQMFPTKPPRIELMRDPEDPESPFVIITVAFQGNAKELVERRIEWHNRIESLPSGSSGAIRLSIVPADIIRILEPGEEP